MFDKDKILKEIAAALNDLEIAHYENSNHKPLIESGEGFEKSQISIGDADKLIVNLKLSWNNSLASSETELELDLNKL